MIRIVFVCTANQCRSPMAKGLYRLHMTQRGCAVEVASAGFLDAGVPVPDQVLDTMDGRGVDLARHRSRRLTRELIAQADLVATMTRQQLVDAAMLAEDAWTRCFTLTDLVRRAEAVGPLGPDGDPSAWVRRLHSSRTRASLLNLSTGDDVPDPINGRPSAFEACADRLDELIGRLTALVCPGPVSP